MKSIKELYQDRYRTFQQSHYGTAQSCRNVCGTSSGCCIFQSNPLRKFSRYRQRTHDGCSHYRYLTTYRPGRNRMATQSLSSVPSERNDICRSGQLTTKMQENWTVYSIGGGALAENNDNPTIESPEVYGMEQHDRNTPMVRTIPEKVIGNT